MKFDKSTYVEVVLFQCRKILKLQFFSVTSVKRSRLSDKYRARTESC